MTKEKLLKVIEAAARRKAKTLDLSGQGLAELPPEIGQLTNLTVLRLNSNILSSLPPEIGQLTNLTRLILFSNKLQSVPPEIGQLTNLTRLILSYNKLQSVPPEIGRLTNLTKLFLFSNKLQSVPPEIGQLTNLTLLELGGNQLTSILLEIWHLTNLTILHLSYNRLKSLPQEISQLTNLTGLTLSDNQLTSLPPEIGQLEKLKYLEVSNNPLERPPLEIAKKGIKEIRAWFESLEGDETLPLNEVKVLLVGAGRSGKTSLVKQLLGEEFDPNEKQTHGIRIRKWQVPRQKDKIRVKFWDFGGQDIMYSTHQFFLSKRSLYIIVLDGRKDEDPEYWLKMIESFGGDSPIMVVLNKIDKKQRFKVNRFHLENKFKGIKGFYNISCKTREGIDNLKKELKKTLMKVKIIKTTWGKTWFDVKTELENMTDNFISYEEYSDMCENVGITDESQQDTLVGFLHDLGDVVHFKDFGLYDTYVLEPKWLTTAVYRIINAPLLKKEHGVLNLRSLINILRKKNKDDEFYCPRSHHPYIVELMKKFELCYDFGVESILVPDLLPNQQPMFFPIDEALRVMIDFDYLPRSVMPRFIVKMHKDIKDNQQWRTGVVLYDKNFNATAMVKSDVDERRIYIYITGDQRRDYLAVILFHFDEIISGFEKINAVREVPIPGEPEVRVDLKHLMTLEKLGEPDFIPVGSEKRYKVKDLLGIVYVEDRSNEEMLRLLQKLVKEHETEESFKKRIADVFSVQIGAGFGVGVSLGKLYDLIEELFKRKK